MREHRKANEELYYLVIEDVGRNLSVRKLDAGDAWIRVEEGLLVDTPDAFHFPDVDKSRK